MERHRSEVGDASARPIELAEFLDTVEGDLELAVELITDLFEEYRTASRTFSRAILLTDALTIERTANGLQGVLGHFGATAARERARRVELAGQDSRLDDAELELRKLEGEMGRLVEFFARPNWGTAA